MNNRPSHYNVKYTQNKNAIVTISKNHYEFLKHFANFYDISLSKALYLVIEYYRFKKGFDYEKAIKRISKR